MAKEQKVRMSEAELYAQGKVPNDRLFAYAAGIAGQNMHYSFINGWLFYFCNNILKISAEAVGYITSISRLWDSVNDPLIGALIDRHRFKNGEKLVLVSNLARKPQTIEIYLPACGDVTNAETKALVAKNGNKVRINLKRNDFTVLIIKK